MSHARARSTTFKIGDKHFYHYLANDTHGSQCEISMVNQKAVDHMTFKNDVINSLGQGADLIASIHGVYHQPSKSNVKQGHHDISFVINERRFEITMAQSRPTWNNTRIDGQPCDPTLFRDQLKAESHFLIPLIYHSLLHHCSKRKHEEDDQYSP